MFIYSDWTHFVAGLVQPIRVLRLFRSQFAHRVSLGRLAPPEHRLHGERCERCRCRLHGDERAGEASRLQCLNPPSPPQEHYLPPTACSPRRLMSRFFSDQEEQLSTCPQVEAHTANCRHNSIGGTQEELTSLGLCVLHFFFCGLKLTRDSIKCRLKKAYY